MRNLALGLSALTASGILIYWVLVFTGTFPVTELVPGYRTWFLSFPLADGWIALTALLAWFYLLKNDQKAALFGLLAGSGLIFLGLYALLYGFNTGLIFNLTTDELIEIAIKIYCLSAGPFLITYFWNYARQTLAH